MKLYTAVIGLFLMCSSVFGQLKVNLSDPNPLDSTIAEYSFCLIVPKRLDGFVTLQCKDTQGQMYHLRFREDKFRGKITLHIHPNQEDGPPTEEHVWNIHLLPEIVIDTATIEVDYLDR